MEQLQQMPLWKTIVTAFCSWVWSDIEGYLYTSIYRYAEFTIVLHIAGCHNQSLKSLFSLIHSRAQKFCKPGNTGVSDSISESVYRAVLKGMYLTLVTQLGDLNCIAETLQPSRGQAGVESPTCSRNISQKLSSALQFSKRITFSWEG